MGNSDAYKKLKKEEGKEKGYVDWTDRPEWIYRVFTKPPGLLVDHFGDKTTFSEAELNVLVTGKVDMARYTQFPKSEYRTLLRRACEALGIVYRPYMLEQIIPPKVQKARIEFPEPREWDLAEKRAGELKKKYASINEDIVLALEAFLKERRKRK